ncbi:MAG: sulfurtransferase [Firmicutes bacterium]|nr:sulfurtransferase [Alicyclobacillaceae bacterium]MCL6496090.1 sulfurtransferase [Bacillota bacterium]
MAVSAQALWQMMEHGQVTVLDIRPQGAYAAAHVPGAVSAPYSRFGWAEAVRRWVQETAAGPNGAQIALFGDNRMLVEAAQRALDHSGVAVAATFDQGVEGWQAAGLPVVAVPNLTADELVRNLQHWTVIDVREPYEWRTGVIPQALKIPLGELPHRIQELDPSRRYAIVCASGNRSQAAAAFLAERGFEVSNLAGGMSVWLGSGHPIERG